MESDRKLRAAYGAEGAKKISQRRAWIEASDTLDDIYRGGGSCHPLKGQYYKGCHALSLHAGWRLVFRLMTPEEQEERGVLDVTSTVIVEIIDYHPG